MWLFACRQCTLNAELNNSRPGNAYINKFACIVKVA